jgi:AcrR family transcriptional regulator
MSARQAAVPEPPWRTARKQVRARRPLDRDRIVDAALRVCDRSGLDAVTMRRVAEELGTGPGSLYAHVADKQELQALMLDQAAGEISPPVAEPSRWENQLIDLAQQIKHALLGHRDLARAALGGIPSGPNSLVLAEAILTLLRAGGLPDRVTAFGVELVFLQINAIVLDEAAYPDDIKAQMREQTSQYHAYLASLPTDRFPNLTDLADTLTAGNTDDRFDFRMRVLIDGLRAQTNQKPRYGQP